MGLRVRIYHSCDVQMPWRVSPEAPLKSVATPGQQALQSLIPKLEPLDNPAVTANCNKTPGYATTAMVQRLRLLPSLVRDCLRSSHITVRSSRQHVCKHPTPKLFKPYILIPQPLCPAYLNPNLSIQQKTLVGLQQAVPIRSIAVVTSKKAMAPQLPLSPCFS